MNSRPFAAGCGLAVACAAVVFGTASAHAQTADFDALAEGVLGLEYVENGISFRELDQRFPGEPGFRPFVAERAIGDLAGFPGFTPPNALGFAGWSPGDGVGYSRLGSITIVPPGVRGRVSVEVYPLEFDAGNTVDFVAFRAGAEVGRQTLPVPTFPVRHFRLELSGVDFDEVRIIGSGPNNQGVFFAVIDTVTFAGGGPSCDPDLNADGNVDQDDVLCAINTVAGNPGCSTQNPDFNGDGNVDQEDVAAVINVVAGGDCP